MPKEFQNITWFQIYLLGDKYTRILAGQSSVYLYKLLQYQSILSNDLQRALVENGIEL